jgi:hypothetical protein|nr:MAG TPA: hypothetical protein [Caudoviricetes sp.]
MQVSFRVSPTAPNPAETTYWIDTTDNNYKGTIKYYNANTKKWEIVNDSTNNQQNEAIKELSTALQAIQATVSTLQRDKVDKVSGKTLSTNDYTTDEKNKLAGIAAQANKTNIVNNLTTSAAGSALDAQQGKVLKDALDALTQRVTALETPAA